MAQKRPVAKRAMFVWLPNFAMTQARLKHPRLAKPQEPLALIEKHGNIRRIAALDGPALRAGLYLHQPLADALAVLPALVTADAEPEADRLTLTKLADWAQRYSPFTAPVQPNGIWLDITGCAHLWGGEEQLAEDMLSRLHSHGIPARAAIAQTFGAAYALAHHAETYLVAPHEAHYDLLAPLPVERLRISEETASLLRKLGLSTIAHIRSLPRSELGCRFPDLLPRFDEAMGFAEEAIEFRRPPTPWIERLRFAEPIAAPEDLERAAATLLGNLCSRLEAKHCGAVHWEIGFFRTDGDIESVRVSTAFPARDAKRLLRLFREKLETVDPGFGVEIAALTVSKTAPLKPRQINLLRPVQSAACIEELAALLDSLENRLGQGRIYRMELQESYIPERAVKRIPPLNNLPLRRGSQQRGSNSDLSDCFDDECDGFEKSEPNSQSAERVRFGERPIRLFARPQPIEVTAALPDEPPIFFRWRKVVHRIRRAEGPERISAEWWRSGTLDGSEDEEAHIRDYYRVENTQGLRFWVYREGTYSGRRPPRWYLHGLFG